MTVLSPQGQVAHTPAVAPTALIQTAQLPSLPKPDPTALPVVASPMIVAITAAAPSTVINGKPVHVWALRADGSIKAIGAADLVP